MRMHVSATLAIVANFLISCDSVGDKAQQTMDSAFGRIEDMDNIYRYESRFKTGSKLIKIDSFKNEYYRLNNISSDSGFEYAKDFLQYVKLIESSSKHISDSIKVIQIKVEDSLRKVSYQEWLKSPAGQLKKIHPDWDQSMCNEQYQKLEEENQRLVSERFWYKSAAGKIQKNHPNWTKEDCERLANKEIWIGMNINMVKYLRGLPDDVNTSNYGNGNQHQYCWFDYNPSCFYCGEDGNVTSYN